MVANKLKCYFVKKTLDYLECLKYSLDCCEDDLKKYYQLYRLSFSDCELTSELECALESEKVTNYYVDCNAGTYIDPVSCSEQLNINIYIVGDTCFNYVNVGNIRLTLKDNSAYQVAEADLVLNSCNSQTPLQTIKGHCVPGSGGVAQCDDTNGCAVYIGKSIYNTSFTPLSPTSRFHSFTMYETDSLGQFVDSPIYILVSNHLTNSATCPGCTTINQNDLQFASPNYKTAMETLFKNISLARYGTDDKIKIETIVTQQGSNISRIELYGLIKHNPAGHWLGFKKAKAPVEYLSGNSYYTSDQGTLFYEVYGSFYKQLGQIGTTLCGQPINAAVEQQPVFLKYTFNSDFNKIVLDPITQVQSFPSVNGGIVGACTNYFLQGVATLTNTNATITSIQWFDSSNQPITPLFENNTPPISRTIRLNTNGNYRFSVTLSNGCTKQYLVTLPDKTITEI